MHAAFRRRSSAIMPAVILALLCGAGVRAEDAQTEMERTIARATDAVYPALIHLVPVTEDFTSGRKRKVTSGGSGVIYTPDGYAITNYHVVSNAKLVFCTMADRTQRRATVVGGDPETDVAVIRIDAAGAGAFPYAKLGDSSILRLGQYVLAMGSPFGFKASVSLGIVSALDRYLPDDATLPTGEQTGSYNAWIQTDAAINFGNSGGPLVNLSGEVVGINSRVMVFGNSIGFSIPINDVKAAAEAIRKHGHVQRSFLGLNLQDTGTLTSLAQTPPPGVLIAGIEADSPLAETGLEPGVLLTAIDGKPLNAPYPSDLPAVRKRVTDLPVGATVSLTVRDLDGTNERTIAATTTLRGHSVRDHLECTDWGFTARDYTPALRRALGLAADKGVLVLGVQESSAAAEGGLEPDDCIIELNEQPVADMTAFRARHAALLAANGADKEYQVLLTVERKRLRKYALLTITPREAEPGE